ncbi:MAG: D-alanyl-D-alanine carboxypeptidase/D-alanyl-D-alanine-endopeptidase [Oceanospirillaceae bacterium]|nr:D-alanyl-D-alanine carboxypeptidase/D-alanyl-D-alanine-endopeptidase [Oceanospirillaceae bacterium]
MLFRCLWILTLVLALPANATALDPVLAGKPSGAQVALLVQPLDGGALQVSHNTDLLLPPASTQKLLTALAAELALGKGYRFMTGLEGRGSASGAVWQGDLKLSLSGAPDFSRTQLGELLDQLKAQGIQRIDGDILLDGSRFSGYERAPGWPWDNLGVCYSAPASAFTIEHNCVAASLDTKGQSQTARLFVPGHQPVSVESDVALVSREVKDDTLCELLLDRGAANQYWLHGCVTDEREVWPLNFAVNDTAAYLGDVLKQELDSRGIALSGQIRPLYEGGEGSWRLLAQVASAPLSELLEEMLQDSDNLYADNLLKTLGAQQGGIGSFAIGVRSLKQILREQAGVDLGLSALKDGSGLSRDNLLTAHQLAAVLGYLNAHPDLVAHRVLPVAGESGTLRYRRSLRYAPLAGKIRAKSGTVNGSSNLAGFIEAASGKRYLFVLLVSGIARGDEPAEAREALTEFERSLLEAVYNRG